MSSFHRILFIIHTLLSYLFFHCNFSSTLWQVMFPDADLTFLFTPEFSQLLNVDSDYPYFSSIIKNTQYIPHKLVQLCHQENTFPHTYPLKNFGHPNRSKSSRPRVIFLRLDSTESLKCNYLISLAENQFRQEYIFGDIAQPQNNSPCISNAALILSSAKLILFSQKNSTFFTIPCSTCDVIISSQLETIISLRAVRQAWDILNLNMHKYLVMIKSSVNATCGLNHNGFSNLNTTNFCPVAVIAEKYNLTLLQYHAPSNKVSVNPMKSFGIVLYTKISNITPTDYIYEVAFKSTNFISVSNPPFHSGGVDTFVTPFDIETWTFLLLTAISAAGILTAASPHVSSTTFLVADKFLAVTCILLGQVGESGGRSYRTVKAGLVLATLWLLGNLVLMGNLYQGSIYSCLAVPIPSPVPSGVEDLVNWDASIIAPDTRDHVGNESYLLNQIIPELISTSGQNPRFRKFLKKFQSKISPRTNETVHKINKMLHETSSRRYPPIILMMSEGLQKQMVRIMRIIGNRRITRNIGDTPFRTLDFQLGDKSLLSSYFAKEWVRLREAGLTQKWDSVLLISFFLRTMKIQLGKEKYFEAVQYAFGSPRMFAQFYEATQVSVELIHPVFPICGIMMGLGVVVVIMEKWKNVHLLNGQ
ncbi:hypothetical protein Fcan01_18158 [Folsomia candida]|uniref:Uncharacterized protein n=1 Tax=Folsomia candida TaxID=158441 RepID=A0A226DPU1_FOLCA|nr:hypothetical protein Fcan01_18158 [Folsomia candida]